MTPRQLETLNHVIDGLTYKEIAIQMSISIRTVETHMEAVRHHLNAKTNAQAVGRYLQGGERVVKEW